MFSRFSRTSLFITVTFLLGGIVAAGLFSSCATIIHGTSQDVGVSSSPSGAVVKVDNEKRGETPVVTELSRDENHTIKIKMDGYQTYETTVTSGVSGWVVGNILFGGLIGLAVDAITGGMYKLTPEQIEANLDRANKDVADLGEDDMYIFVVLKPDPDWEKVGSLKRN